MEIAYGHRVTSENDSYVEISEQGMRAAAASGRWDPKYTSSVEKLICPVQRGEYAHRRVPDL